MQDEADTLTVWLDVALNMLGGFILMVLLLLALETSAKKAEKEGNESQGDVQVEIQWPDNVNADVDLWVKSPGDTTPVGYSNKSGHIMNLLRDDLGYAGDFLKANMEIAYARGCPAGEYVVNLHAYRNLSPFPIPVKVQVSTKERFNGIPSTVANPIIQTATRLTKAGEEITAVRFTLDSNCKLVPGTVNHVFKGMREAHP